MSETTEFRLSLTCDSEGVPSCPVNVETFVAETEAQARLDAFRAGWIWVAQLGPSNVTICPHCVPQTIRGSQTEGAT